MISALLHISAPLIIALAIAAAALLLLSEIYKLTNLRSQPTKFPPNQQPHLTVLIYGPSSAQQLARCIRAINQSSYKKVDVVIVRRSTERISKLDASFLLTKSKRTLKIYNMRSKVSETECLRRAYAKSQRGDTVVTLSPNMTIDPKSLRRIAARRDFLDSSAIQLSKKYHGNLSIDSLLPIVLLQSQQVFQQARQLFGHPSARPQTGFAYSKQWFLSKQAVPHRLDDAIIACVSSFQIRQSPLTILFLTLLGATLAAVSLAAIHAAAHRITAHPLLLICLLTAFWLLAVVWLDDKMHFKDKIKISLTAPSAYFIIIVAIFATALKPVAQTLTKRLSHI